MSNQHHSRHRDSPSQTSSSRYGQYQPTQDSRHHSSSSRTESGESPSSRHSRQGRSLQTVAEMTKDPNQTERPPTPLAQLGDPNRTILEGFEPPNSSAGSRQESSRTVVQETAVLEEAFVRRVHEVRETVCLRETVVLEEAFARRAREVREIVVQTIRDPTLRVRCKHQSMGGVIRRASPQQPCHRPLCLEHLLMLKASLWTITTLRWQHDKIAMTI
jgi:hypothetical protein